MADWFHEQHIIWQRLRVFKKMGMRESYLILFNGWLTMEGVLTKETYFNEHFLTNDFLK
ncbi:hypothetical protein LCGC14_2377070 [marine sediment metagenome]|uniref:Uncharacterized protein n=1 Tax=marine sediment metagenome TaxID=412755 RepID=A0A0F9CPC4_9ZZZZ